MQVRYWYFDNGAYGMGREELRPIKDDEFLVKTTRTLVSVGTETACNAGKLRWKQGRHGYSHAGVVVEVGKAVTGMSVGEHIFGESHHSEYAIYRSGVSADSFAKIPDGVDDAEAIYASLATVGFHALERATISIGQPVVVVGQGTVGQLAQQLARLAGAGLVIAVDVDESRLELSRRLGADAAITPDAAALEAALAAAPACSAAPAFIEVSGSARAAGWIIDVAPLRSRVVLAGGHSENITISPSKVIAGELDILGAHGPKLSATPHLFYPYNLRAAIGYVLDCLRSKRLRARELSDGQIRPDELMAYYDASRDNKPRLRQPIIRWD